MRRYWILLAALLFAAFVVGFVHHSLWTAAPDPEFFPDSDGYLTPALECLTHGKFTFSPIRTPGYPLFLLVVLQLFKGLPAVTVLQHLLLVATGMMTGMIFYRFIRGSILTAIAVGTVAAVLPRPVALAQQLLTETLYTFVEVALLYSLSAALEEQDRRRWWAASGILCVLAAFVRPVGEALLIALTLGIWILQPRGQRRRALTSAGIPVLLLSTLWCSLNFKQYGFWGFTEFSGRSLLINTAYLIPAGTSHSAERTWSAYGGEDVIKSVEEEHLPLAQEDAALRACAFKAIASRPLRFIGDQCAHFAWFIWENSKRPPGSLSIFHNARDSLLRYLPYATAHPDVNPYLQIARESPELYLARAETAHLYPYERSGPLGSLLWPLIFLERWLPVLGFSAVLFCLRRRAAPLSAFLLLIATGHILLTNLGGSRSGRQGAPLEPVYLLMALSCCRGGTGPARSPE